ncbi:mannitol dehydrogenase family protein [Microbacterium sp. SS28]|uniref:mannitol dehydrogenase family protein n=1 Tax=Microbacterium sp. SS28 TaxID=2919948 RepID=UPI001FAA2E5E|nr:mannitol dehydrogenase family protein [Microbacterium sp. SS28]
MSEIAPAVEPAPRIHRTDAAPVRIVHIGLGAFHRSHQAWYTARASDADEWGIAAFTGRSNAASDLLEAQDCVYTVIERSADGDRFRTVETIVEAHPGDDIGSFLELLRRPEIAIVTVTVTEAGYLLGADGMLAIDNPVVAADISAIRAGSANPPVRSLVAKLTLGLLARYATGAPALAVISCDNLPDNGRALARACEAFAELIEPGTATHVRRAASFVCTSVDRITPRTTPADVDAVLTGAGYIDLAPVVTEPFADWVLEGRFPAGHPDWQSAGARFVADIAPWELRKLWLLNGAHTLMAALGTLLDLETVDQVIRDPSCREAVGRWWDEACRHLPDGLDLDTYRSNLLARFENPRIAHRLDQIAQDARAKLRIRTVPVALREVQAGRRPGGALTAIAAVLRADDVAPAVADIAEALDPIEPRLARNSAVVAEIARIAQKLPGPSEEPPRLFPSAPDDGRRGTPTHLSPTIRSHT